MTNSKRARYVLGIDPSGNFFEGKGTTGWSVYDRDCDNFLRCGAIRADKALSQQSYWQEHLELINQMIKTYGKYGLVVSMEDFVLYSRQAKAQINSALETSQLIGVIKLFCWHKHVKLYIRTASQVKNRWTDNIMCNKCYIRKENSSFFADFKAGKLSDHERDSMRHAVHCAMFELTKEEIPNDNKR